MHHTVDNYLSLLSRVIINEIRQVLVIARCRVQY